MMHYAVGRQNCLANWPDCLSVFPWMLSLPLGLSSQQQRIITEESGIFQHLFKIRIRFSRDNTFTTWALT